MITEKIEIKVCLGNSCSSRGNTDMPKLIRDFIAEHNLEEKVIVKGSPCMSFCSSGPNLKINDKVYHRVDKFKIYQILKDSLGIEQEQEYGTISENR